MLDTRRVLVVCSGCPRPWLRGPQLIRALAKVVSAPLAPSCPGGMGPGATCMRPASITRRESTGQVPKGSTSGHPWDASSSAGFPADDQTLSIV